MASIQINIDNEHYHNKPTTYANGTITVTRDSERDEYVKVSGAIDIIMGSSQSHYGVPPYAGDPRGFSFYISTPQQTSGDIDSVYNIGYGGTKTGYISDNGNPISIKWTDGSLVIHITCNWLDYHTCDAGYDDIAVGSAYISDLPYNPRVDPTPPNDGAIYSTNNSGGVHRGTISDKPDNKVWWDWWGQNGGTVGLKQANVDISKTNDSNTASSVSGVTTNYVQNTRVNIFDIAKNKGAHIGDTLYCWVNILTYEDVWLGRRYLGALTLRKDGSIKYKDSNGTSHEVTKVYYKDSSGTTKKGRYATVKDGNGATHVIDVYTTLYE